MPVSSLAFDPPLDIVPGSAAVPTSGRGVHHIAGQEMRSAPERSDDKGAAILRQHVYNKVFTLRERIA